MPKIKEFDKKKHLLNYEKMDTLHLEFLDIYNSVNINSNESIKLKSTELFIHTKRHFLEEEKLMDRYNYPRSMEHKNEHNKLMSLAWHYTMRGNSLKVDKNKKKN